MRLILIVLLSLASIVHAGSIQHNSEAKDLRVAVLVEEEPISYADKHGIPHGMAVDIWSKVAKELGWTNKFILLHDRHQAILDIEDNKYDVLIGPLEISNKIIDEVDFSIPYFVNSIGIVSRDNKISFMRIIQELNTGLLDASFLYTIVLFFVFSIALYIADRKKHPELNSVGVLTGLGNSMWAIVSTFLRDLIYTPATTAGRVVMSLWMICSVIFMTVIASSITASILNISSKSLTEYSTPDDLYGKKVAVMEDSRSVELANAIGAKIKIAKSEKELLGYLHHYEVDAVLEDKVIAQHYLDIHPELHLHLTESTLAKDMFAFVFQHHSELRTPVNTTLATFQEYGHLKEICSKYLEKNREDCIL